MIHPLFTVIAGAGVCLSVFVLHTQLLAMVSTDFVIVACKDNLLPASIRAINITLLRGPVCVADVCIVVGPTGDPSPLTDSI